MHLVDAHHCADPAKFISVLLVTLSTMVQLEMPQVNLLSKVDMIEKYGELAFGLDFYTDVLDPSRLLPMLLRQEGGSGSAFARRHHKLNEAIQHAESKGVNPTLIQQGKTKLQRQASQ